MAIDQNELRGPAIGYCFRRRERYGHPGGRARRAFDRVRGATRTDRCAVAGHIGRTLIHLSNRSRRHIVALLGIDAHGPPHHERGHSGRLGIAARRAGLDQPVPQPARILALALELFDVGFFDPAEFHQAQNRRFQVVVIVGRGTAFIKNDSPFPPVVQNRRRAEIFGGLRFEERFA